MNIKNKILKYSVTGASIMALAGSVAIASASAQLSENAAVPVQVNTSVAGAAVSAGASANVNTSMKGMYMPGGRMGSTSRMMGSSTRMSSTTREQMMEQRQGQAIGQIDTHSASEISGRITSLNNLLTRLNGMTKVSASQKASITTEVQNLIAELTTLQAKIQVDASSTPTGARGDLSSSSPLRMDVQSITKDYRVYALVIPQIEILAAADRAETIVVSLNTLSAKLQTRIATLQAAGKDVTALQASLSDMNAKSADAQTQATAAITVTASLTPDNGNATVAASNDAALKTGRADIQTADSDIKTATADAKSIVKGVEAFGNTASTSASVSASAAGSVQ